MRREAVLVRPRDPLHTARTQRADYPILVRAISLEKSVPETFLFRAPSFEFSFRPRLHFLPPAPFNASDEGCAGVCCMLKVKAVTMSTMRNRQIFQILHPGW